MVARPDTFAAQDLPAEETVLESSELEDGPAFAALAHARLVDVGPFGIAGRTRREGDGTSENAIELRRVRCGGRTTADAVEVEAHRYLAVTLVSAPRRAQKPERSLELRGVHQGDVLLLDVALAFRIVVLEVAEGKVHHPRDRRACEVDYVGHLP